jgi:hypothetical protein
MHVACCGGYPLWRRVSGDRLAARERRSKLEGERVVLRPQIAQEIKDLRGASGVALVEAMRNGVFHGRRGSAGGGMEAGRRTSFGCVPAFARLWPPGRALQSPFSGGRFTRAGEAPMTPLRPFRQPQFSGAVPLAVATPPRVESELYMGFTMGALDPAQAGAAARKKGDFALAVESGRFSEKRGVEGVPPRPNPAPALARSRTPACPRLHVSQGLYTRLEPTAWKLARQPRCSLHDCASGSLQSVPPEEGPARPRARSPSGLGQGHCAADRCIVVFRTC